MSRLAMCNWGSCWQIYSAKWIVVMAVYSLAVKGVKTSVKNLLVL